MTRLVPLKIARIIQNYHPVQVPQLSAPDDFQMNFDNSWIVNYDSKKVRKKKENFDNMYFDTTGRGDLMW